MIVVGRFGRLGRGSFFGGRVSRGEMDVRVLADLDRLRVAIAGGKDDRQIVVYVLYVHVPAAWR